MQPSTRAWAALVGAGPLSVLLLGLLGPNGLFLGWAATVLGLWWLRHDPQRGPGVKPAAAAWVALVVLALYGMGVTIGSQGGAVANVGGEQEALPVTGIAMLFVPGLPLALLLARTSGGTARRLAWATVSVAALLLLAGVLWTQNPPSTASGDAAEMRSLLLVLAVAGYLLLAVALVVEKLRPGPWVDAATSP